MKYSNIFKSRINCDSSDEVFNYLINTLKDTITKWDYFVNWDKVYANLKDLEIDLNIMNYLIGKDNLENEFKELLKKHPSVARLLPVLIACRQNSFKILYDFDAGEFKYKRYLFESKNKLSEAEISDIIEFADSVGFSSLLRDKKIKNLVDYLLGVEVGLDSNGRKNRGGTQMEDIVEFFIEGICSRNKFEYIKEATSSKVYQKWNLMLPVDKSSRKVDFVVLGNNQLYLIETNFYAGGGSKLKSTAGEYRTMYEFWKKDGLEFIWITDGFGWKSTRLPLRETFNHTDYILNLDMVSQRLLEDIIIRNV